MSVDHYENFPVASWLCPPPLRPPIEAIYHFARTADDLADEGQAAPQQRLAWLQAYRECLRACARDTLLDDKTSSSTAPMLLPEWPRVFDRLRVAMADHRLPLPLLEALLDAFEQDVRNPPYPDRTSLLHYCERSAHPVGRLLLHLYAVDDPASLAQSDAICSALQLINFWQDLGVDLKRGRCYLPQEDLQRHGLDLATLRAIVDTPPVDGATSSGPASTAASGASLLPGSHKASSAAQLCAELVAELVNWAEDLMHQGSPLVHRLPGRAGWELRLVVQGGLRILEKIRRMNHDVLVHRPTVSIADAPALMWRALLMPPSGKRR